MTRPKNLVMYNPDLSNKIHDYLTVSPTVVSYFQENEEYIKKAEKLMKNLREKVRELKINPKKITTILYFNFDFYFESDSKFLFSIPSSGRFVVNDVIYIKMLLNFFENVNLIILHLTEDIRRVKPALLNILSKKMLKKVKFFLIDYIHTDVV